MAEVSQGFRGEVELVDNGGNTTRKTYWLRSTDAAGAATDMTAIIAAITNVTDAVILGYSFGEVFAQDSASYPASGVEIENQALIGTSIVGDLLKTATYTIPAPKPGIFVATSGDGANVVDVADAAVVAYQALFTAAGHAFISDGEDAAFIGSGKRIHRASRRG